MRLSRGYWLNWRPGLQALQGSVIVSFGGSVRGTDSSGHHGSEFPADAMASAGGEQCVMSHSLLVSNLTGNAGVEARRLPFGPAAASRLEAPAMDAARSSR